MDRHEYEHVKDFLHKMEMLISPIALKAAVKEGDSTDRGWGNMTYHRVASLINDAWIKALNGLSSGERFSSLADAHFMEDAVRAHFRPILSAYGVEGDHLDDVVKTIRLDMENGSNIWGEERKEMKNNIFSLCGETNSKEVALDNMWALISMGVSELGAKLSRISPECIRSIMNVMSTEHVTCKEVQTPKGLELQGNFSEVVMLVLSSLQAGNPVPDEIFSFIKGLGPRGLIDAIFHSAGVGGGISVKNLSGKPRQQLSEILSIGAQDPTAAALYAIFFDIPEEKANQMAADAHKGIMTYL